MRDSSPTSPSQSPPRPYISAARCRIMSYRVIASMVKKWCAQSLDSISRSTLVLGSFKCYSVRLLFPFTSFLFHVLTSPYKSLSWHDILVLRTSQVCRPRPPCFLYRCARLLPRARLLLAPAAHGPAVPPTQRRLQALALPNSTVAVGLPLWTELAVRPTA
jgi:hypothetical protein